MTRAEFAVQSLDHLVLTVRDPDATIAFYAEVLGLRADSFLATDGTTRWALSFGAQKINLHPASAPFDPKASHPTPGSADLCFLTETDIDLWVQHLSDHEIEIIDGPIKRTGATGPLLSVYVRDPDGNLIEISRPC